MPKSSALRNNTGTSCTRRLGKTLTKSIAALTLSKPREPYCTSVSGRTHGKLLIKGSGTATHGRECACNGSWAGFRRQSYSELIEQKPDVGTQVGASAIHVKCVLFTILVQWASPYAARIHSPRVTVPLTRGSPSRARPCLRAKSNQRSAKETSSTRPNSAA